MIWGEKPERPRSGPCRHMAGLQGPAASAAEDLPAPHASASRRAGRVKLEFDENLPASAARASRARP
jgi:hypothetical protein